MNVKVKHTEISLINFVHSAWLFNLSKKWKLIEKKRKRNKEHQENTDHKPNKMLHSKNIQVERKLSNEFHSGWFANELFHIAWVFGIGFNLRWSLNDAKSFGQVLIDIAPFGTVLRLQMLLKARTHTHATAIGIHFKWKTFFQSLFWMGFFACFFFFNFWCIQMRANNCCCWFFLRVLSSLEIKIFQTIEMRIRNVLHIRSAC